jgi:serine/threonine protein phosphatase 1
MGWGIFRKRAEPVSRLQQACLPEGQRVYAIGDVHGRFDLLIALLRRIKADDAQRPAAETHVVMLGDLIDRGPYSAEVVEYLRGHRDGFATFHFIMGNHEEAMLDSITPSAIPEEIGWLGYGGHETMLSYGADPSLFTAEGAELAAAMRRLVPRTHIEFLESFNDKVQIGDYLFVHAGIRPGIAVEHQDARDLRWIREPFLQDESDHGVVVIHGHSIVEEPEIRHNRIGIDTGAYRTGLLTALALEGGDRWLMMEQL